MNCHSSSITIRNTFPGEKLKTVARASAYSVFKQAINTRRSSSDKSSPNSCPFTSRVVVNQRGKNREKIDVVADATLNQAA